MDGPHLERTKAAIAARARMLPDKMLDDAIRVAEETVKGEGKSGRRVQLELEGRVENLELDRLKWAAGQTLGILKAEKERRIADSLP